VVLHLSCLALRSSALSARTRHVPSSFTSTDIGMFEAGSLSSEQDSNLTHAALHCIA
jgi:hypothetical protein